MSQESVRDHWLITGLQLVKGFSGRVRLTKNHARMGDQYKIELGNAEFIVPDLFALINKPSHVGPCFQPIGAL